MKVNKIFIVSLFLLAILSLGAASAADDTAADDLAVEDAGDVDLEVPAGEEISTDSDTDNVAVGENVTYETDVSGADTLGASPDDEKLSDRVEPTYTHEIDLTKSGANYIAQWGQPIVVHANFTDATGNVTLTFAGETYTTDLVDGAFTYSITKYTEIKNNQVLTVTYNGDENYKPVTFQDTIHIRLNGNNVKITGGNFGQIEPFADVNLFNATGNVTLTVNGVSYRKELVNGTASYEFKKYDIGTNSVLLEYGGDENYNPISTTFNLKMKLDGSINRCEFGQSAIANVNLYNATGNVTFTINGVTYRTELVNGHAVQELKSYNLGSNTVTVAYEGDENYEPFSTTLTLTTTFTNFSVTGCEFGQSAIANVNLYNATGNVTFTINGVTYRTELVNGHAVQELKSYNLGSNTVTIIYEGDENYKTFSQSNARFTTTANISPAEFYNNQPAIITVKLGESTGNVTFTWAGETQTVGIVNGFATFEATNYNMGDNTIAVSYSGDDTFKAFSTTHKFTILEKENATILSSVYKTADKNMVVICISQATGNVTAVINGKKEILELVNGVATYAISASDVITEINVTYEGDFRFNPTNSSAFTNLENNVVNNDTYRYYFDQDNYGKLFEFIEPGTTLDFQGSIINPDMNNAAYMDISIPINIISTTNDAFVNLNSPDRYAVAPIIKANSFIISHGGSWSNITGITIYNTQVWITNTSHVTMDSINITCTQRIGSGTGHTTIRDNTTYLTLKNSYIYSWNTGSSGFVLTWADYCTFDNNTFAGIAGGNFIYFWPGTYTGTINTNNTFINNRIGDGINSVNIVGTGPNTVFVNNTVLKCSGAGGVYVVGNIIDGGGLSISSNGIGYDNYMTGGLGVGPNAIAYNNTALGVMAVGKEGEAFNNTVGGLTLSGDDSLVHDNIIKGAVTINNANNAQIYDNTFLGDYTISINAKNITFSGNDVIGNIVFNNQNAMNNRILNNTITTSKDYAVDLKTFEGTGNVIADNILNSKNGFGNDAVNHVEDNTLIIDNYQNILAEISIVVKDIKVGENAVFNVTTNETSISSATVIVDGKKYTVNLVNGKGSVEVADLLVGKYVVTVTSDDLTYGARNTTSFTVDKNRSPRIEVDTPTKTQWVESNITVTIKRATGTVTLDINGVRINGQLVDGVVSLAVPDLAIGSYDFNITYSGDDKYEGNTTGGTLTVVKNKQIIIIAEDVTVDVVADKFTAKFTNYIGEAIANANVTITIGDAVYPKVTDENGTVTVDLALYRGQYDVNVEFKAIADEFDAATAKCTITVVDGSIMKILSVDGEGIVTGLLTDVMGNPVANAKVTATMNGIESNLTTDNDGLFKFQAQNGYQVVFSFEGDNTTTLSNASITLNNVAHVLEDSVINVADVKLVAVDTAAGEKGKAYKFTLKDAQGNAIANKNVKVVLDGKVYSVVTDANGIASFVISLNAAKTYNMDVFFLGDDDYKGATASAKVTVTKKATTLKAAKTKYTFKAKAKSKVIKATLKTSNKYLKAGKKVTIKIKGKTYTAKTNKKGAIKIKLKSLKKKGTYKAKIKFAGDSTYKASSSKTIKIVIK